MADPPSAPLRVEATSSDEADEAVSSTDDEEMPALGDLDDPGFLEDLFLRRRFSAPGPARARLYPEARPWTRPEALARAADEDPAARPRPRWRGSRRWHAGGKPSIFAERAPTSPFCYGDDAPHRGAEAAGEATRIQWWFRELRFRAADASYLAEVDAVALLAKAVRLPPDVAWGIAAFAVADRPRALAVHLHDDSAVLSFAADVPLHRRREYAARCARSALPVLRRGGRAALEVLNTLEATAPPPPPPRPRPRRRERAASLYRLEARRRQRDDVARRDGARGDDLAADGDFAVAGSYATPYLFRGASYPAPDSAAVDPERAEAAVPEEMRAAAYAAGEATQRLLDARARRNPDDEFQSQSSSAAPASRQSQSRIQFAAPRRYMPVQLVASEELAEFRAAQEA
jgi:hypothetical protein